MNLTHVKLCFLLMTIEIGEISRSHDKVRKSPTTLSRSIEAALKSEDNTVQSQKTTSRYTGDILMSFDDSLKSAASVLENPLEQRSKCLVCQMPETRSTCHIISGVFTRDRLAAGNHVITTIPQNACRINITGMNLGSSQLILTTAFGEEILNPAATSAASSMHFKQAAGTVFTYYKASTRDNDRNDDENDDEDDSSSLQYILSDGPTDRSVEIQIKKECVQEATQILYTYTVVRNNQSTATSHRTRHHRNPRSLVAVIRDAETTRSQNSGKSVKHRSTTEKNNHANKSSSWKKHSKETHSNKTSVLKIFPHDVQDIHLEMTSSWTGPRSRAEVELSDQPPLTGPGNHATNQGNQKWNLNWNQKTERKWPSSRETPLDVRYVPPSSQEGHSSHYTLAGDYQSPPAVPMVEVDARFHFNEFVSSNLPEHRMGLDDPQTNMEEEENYDGDDYADTYDDDDDDHNDEYDHEYESEFREEYKDPYSPTRSDDHQRMEGMENGALYGSSEFNSKPQKPQSDYFPADYISGYGQKEHIAQVPAFQKRQSDPTVHYSSSLYGNPFSPSVAGHPITYGDRSQRSRQQKPTIGHQQLTNNGYFPSRDDSLLDITSRHAPQTSNQYADTFRGFLQKGETEEEEPVRYAWKISGFTNCSRTCGGGTQSTLVVCVKLGHSPVQVTDENCEGNLKPKTTNISCNTRPCQPSWEVDEWGACSTTCNKGRQKRKIECRLRVTSAVIVGVQATRCQHKTQPETERDCNADRPCFAWKADEWSQCSSACGRGRRFRKIVCEAANGSVVDDFLCETGGRSSRPRTVEECEMEPCSKSWYNSKWSTQCSSDCGGGFYTRRVHCGADNKKCNTKTKPVTAMECRSQLPCGGRWFTSSWLPCGVTCGQGVRHREVACIKKLETMIIVVSDENCVGEDLPITVEPCQEAPCPPLWFTTDWSKCSKTCNRGIQVRETKCLDDKERPSQLCDPLEKPDLKQTCNDTPCASKLSKTTTQPLVVSCRDQMKNCQVVVQARLCGYSYYKEACCYSCSSRREDAMLQAT